MKKGEMVREEPQPEAGKSFLEYLVSTGEKDVDLNNAPSFDTTALHAVYDIRASEGKLVCKFPVTELVQNRFNTLHGGCIGSLLPQGLLPVSLLVYYASALFDITEFERMWQ